MLDIFMAKPRQSQSDQPIMTAKIRKMFDMMCFYEKIFDRRFTVGKKKADIVVGCDFFCTFAPALRNRWREK
jgi:hypothetical protein